MFQLNKIIILSSFSYLWFFLEPILAKADNYSFLKKLVENVKETKDAQAPDNEEVNKVKHKDAVILSYQFWLRESSLQLCS